MIEILKCLSDWNRLRILCLLDKAGECCVCDLEESLEMNQSNVSKHMAKMKADRVISVRKTGRWSYYSLNPETIQQYSFIKILLSEADIPPEDYERFLSLQKDKELRCK